MIITLLATALVMVVLFGLPLMYMSGWNRGVAQGERLASKQLEYTCAHVWGSWDDVKVAIISPSTGKKMYEMSGQRRYCEVCGKKEIERIDS